MINEENVSSTKKKENKSQLKKPKNILKPISQFNDEKYSADYSSEKEDKYLFSLIDFSDLINKRLDEYSDDDFSYLKKEIDSYIKDNDEEAESNINSQNKSNENLSSNKKCNLFF
jgi:hypothetical protein